MASDFWLDEQSLVGENLPQRNAGNASTQQARTALAIGSVDTRLR